MFYYIDGTVTHIESQLAVVDCAGVGYALNTTANTIAGLKTGERAKLYTYLHIREDIFDLYGFLSRNEKRSFELLIGVSGVGPKAALSILSSGTPESLAMAVINGNEKALTLAQGVGKKIAQRIILELKDKISKETEGIIPVSMQTAGDGASTGKLGDAVSALAVLGYGNAEIAAALSGVDTQCLSLEEIIKAALRKMVVK